MGIYYQTFLDENWGLERIPEELIATLGDNIYGRYPKSESWSWSSGTVIYPIKIFLAPIDNAWLRGRSLRHFYKKIFLPAPG
jgi:hypothetical protein